MMGWNKGGLWTYANMRQSIGLGVEVTWAYDSVSLYITLPFAVIGVGYEWEGK